MSNRKLLNDELGRLSAEEFAQSARMPYCVVLDNVRSQFNIGAAFRSADAFATQKVVLCGICATPPTAEIHKSALGAELSMGWEYYKETSEAVLELKKEGYTIVCIEQAVDSVYLNDVADFIERKSLNNEKFALIFGNEVHGVEQKVVDMADFVVEIPQKGTKHSINVSVSVGVVLWEFFKTLH